MKLERFEVPGLAHYSYLLGSAGKALVIDPKRDVESYIEYANAHDLKITHVLETHIHADYVSGTCELVARTGAEPWLSAHDNGEEFQYQFEHKEFRDGEELILGDIRLVALHTPGHTPEHLSFLVYEQNRCGQPVALFSGDFILVGSLGRPDLLGEGKKSSLASALYDSVHQKIAHLPDGVEVYPAHGSGSLCGVAIAERPQSTLGYERFCNVFMVSHSQEQFVHEILASVPELPEYYRRMKRVNSEGPKLLAQLPVPEGIPAAKLNQQIESTLLIDLRGPEAFGGAHIPMSYNIGGGDSLAVWAAFVIPGNRPVALVGHDATDIPAAIVSLRRVGIDTLCGFLQGGIKAWIDQGFDQGHVSQISVRELAEKVRLESTAVLDVRSPKEWDAGHIEHAIHIPGGKLQDRIDEIPSSRSIHVICGSGYRSSIAASILKRHGYVDVVNVVGGMAAWKAQKLPTVSSS